MGLPGQKDSLETCARQGKRKGRTRPDGRDCFDSREGASTCNRGQLAKGGGQITTFVGPGSATGVEASKGDYGKPIGSIFLKHREQLMIERDDVGFFFRGVEI